jgi:hypothetical protein
MSQVAGDAHSGTIVKMVANYYVGVSGRTLTSSLHCCIPEKAAATIRRMYQIYPVALT